MGIIERLKKERYLRKTILEANKLIHEYPGVSKDMLFNIKSDDLEIIYKQSIKVLIELGRLSTYLSEDDKKQERLIKFNFYEKFI